MEKECFKLICYHFVTRQINSSSSRRAAWIRANRLFLQQIDNGVGVVRAVRATTGVAIDALYKYTSPVVRRTAGCLPTG